MVAPKQFVDTLAGAGVDFFTGVPDSLLKDLLAYIDESVPQLSLHGGAGHVTAANEGAAIGIAAGYHLATGKVACVYMQNSGLGNAVNPLVSLADKEVYAIPMLLVIGWRGEPGVKDEPQHVKQGRITPGLLDVLEIPHTDKLEDVGALIERAKKESRPVALVVRAGAFEPHPSKKSPATTAFTREAAIEAIVGAVEPTAIIVSTTGKISRELYEVRKRARQGGRDFLTVGSMGHANQIALGIALQKPDRSVYCIDGDGATIMHMGALATVGWLKPKNFRHIVLNNRAHESVGGQRSAAEAIDLCSAARACGYTTAKAVSAADLAAGIAHSRGMQGPLFIEVLVNLDSRADLARPVETPQENKKTFIDFLR